jgi:hypothetical protein
VVPTSYHEFFAGCASVAGALVGLLFVAVSISSESLSGADATIAFQRRAAAAFSVLVNALVITLFALLPDTNLGIVALVTGISGVGATCGLLLIQLRESDLRRVSEFVLVLILPPQGPSRTRRSWSSCVSWSASAGPGNWSAPAAPG